MPRIASLTEFNRNQSEVIAELQETGEPMYLTRNGKAAVVVMDAAAFDRMSSTRQRARALEEEVYASLMRGYRDLLDGKTVSLDQLDSDIRAERAW